MIEIREIALNQKDKIRDLKPEETPHCFYYYSNGVHLLFIKRNRSKYQLCGLNLPFGAFAHETNFDIYYEDSTLIGCIREYERFISLLLLPRRFEGKKKDYDGDSAGKVQEEFLF